MKALVDCLPHQRRRNSFPLVVSYPNGLAKQVHPIFLKTPSYDTHDTEVNDIFFNYRETSNVNKSKIYHKSSKYDS